MNELIDRLQHMGRKGGFIALGIAVVSLPGSALLAYLSLFVIEGRWFPGILGFAAAMLLVGTMTFGMLGLRLLTQTHYPSAAEIFPPLSKAEFEDAVRNREHTVCACTRCHVVLDAAYSTGACPVCASSVDYYEVDSDEDADMVILALS
jgi:RNA polymerase subunit RPABC4/transcription elongation factor Spt4